MISTRVESINRDIELLMADGLSDAGRSATLAAFAEEEIEAAAIANRLAMGAETGKQVTVDGKIGAPLTTVRPDGIIAAEFNLLGDLIDWIGAQLVLASPRRSGRYAASHVMFVDGQQSALDAEVSGAREVAFVNVQPYARKIERGLSSQAPDGVYQSVAAVAARRFGNVARVLFGYRSIAGKAKTDRQPAIIVRIG